MSIKKIIVPKLALKEPSKSFQGKALKAEVKPRDEEKP